MPSPRRGVSPWEAGREKPAADPSFSCSKDAGPKGLLQQTHWVVGDFIIKAEKITKKENYFFRGKGR